MDIRLFNLDEMPVALDTLASRMQTALRAAGFIAEVEAVPQLPKLSIGRVRLASGRYLKPDDWLRLFDFINDTLDTWQAEALADTFHYRFRVGSHRRIAFDDQIRRVTKLFELRRTVAIRYGQPADYAPSPYSELINPRGENLAVMVRPRTVED